MGFCMGRGCLKLNLLLNQTFCLTGSRFSTIHNCFNECCFFIFVIVIMIEHLYSATLRAKQIRMLSVLACAKDVKKLFRILHQLMEQCTVN